MLQLRRIKQSQEENNVIPQDYLKGFNEGYFISKQAPEFGSLITQLSDTDRGAGMKAGHKQFLAEKNQERLKPKWLSNEIDKKSNEGKSQNKDRDCDIEK